MLNGSLQVRGVNVWGQGWQVAAGKEARVNDPVFGLSISFPKIHQEGYPLGYMTFFLGSFMRG